eukprot:scaffold144536_cov21-Tisochrysis_lutea.AAC.1
MQTRRIGSPVLKDQASRLGQTNKANSRSSPSFRRSQLATKAGLIYTRSAARAQFLKPMRASLLVTAQRCACFFRECL